MQKILSWIAGSVITALFIVGLAYIEATPQKISKPEFVPGQKILIQADRFMIEATVDEPQRVNYSRKGDRLIRADGEPMEEYVFHTAKRR